MQDIDRMLAGIRHTIRRHGRAVIGVLGKGKAAPFACAVGLWHTFRHAEILMVGLSIECMQQIINAVGGRAQAEEMFVAGRAYNELVEPYPCVFRIVPPAAYWPWANVARVQYGATPSSRGCPVLRCVWPQTRRKSPCESAFEERLQVAQLPVSVTGAV